MAYRLLTGLALGLVVGVLLAPEKGSDTRAKLSQKGKDLKNKFNDFIDGLHDKFDNMKDDAENMADRAKAKARSFSNETTGNSWNA